MRTLTGHSASGGASFYDQINTFPTIYLGDSDASRQQMEQVHTMIVRSDSFNAVGHREEINAVAISYDSKYIISASSDKTLKVWNWQTGEQLCTLNGHSDSVNTVAISNDNKYAISASNDTTLKVWSLQKMYQS